MIGARRTITRRVTEADLVTSLYPDFVKPPVLATARLVEWCERAAMEEMGECSLGTKMHVSHIAPAVLGGLITVTAVCTGMSGSYSDWRIAARDEHEVIALGTLGFVVVDMARYLSRRLSPKQPAERSRISRTSVVVASSGADEGTGSRSTSSKISAGCPDARQSDPSSSPRTWCHTTQGNGGRAPCPATAGAAAAG